MINLYHRGVYKFQFQAESTPRWENFDKKMKFWIFLIYLNINKYFVFKNQNFCIYMYILIHGNLSILSENIGKMKHETVSKKNSDWILQIYWYYFLLFWITCVPVVCCFYIVVKILVCIPLVNFMCNTSVQIRFTVYNYVITINRTVSYVI